MTNVVDDLPEAVHLDVHHAMILLPGDTALGPCLPWSPPPLSLGSPLESPHLLVLRTPLDSVGTGTFLRHASQCLLKQVL